MRDLAFVGLLTLWAAVVGRAVLRGLGASLPRHRADALALTLPLGFGLLALAVLALGELGWLSAGGLVMVLAAGGIISIADVLIHRKDGGPCPPYGIANEQVSYGVWDGLFDLALAVGLIGVILTSLSPVTDGDALCYHLQVPKVFLAWGAVGFDPDLHETVYPLGVEALYALALAFRGPVACRLIQVALGAMLALNVMALARPALGSRARWAAAVTLLVPAVSNGMGAPLNDVALAAFGMASLHALMRWREEPGWRNAVMTGMLGGFAIGVKYPALVWVGLLGMVMAWWSCCRQSRRHVIDLLPFALAVLFAGGWWYLRAALWTGNPVYPFFRHTFGGHGLDVVLNPIKRPLDVTFWNMLTALGPMTLDPERFDSVAHQFGPAFLLFLPGLFLLRPPRRVAGLVGLGWLFLTVCLTQRQSMRFLLIAVGPMAVGVAWVAAELRRREGLASRVVLVALLAVLLFEAGIAARRSRHGLEVVLGRESAESFLSRREPTVVVGQWIDASLPRNAHLIGQDHRGYYIPRPYTMELAHRRRTGLASGAEPASVTIERMRASGFTHLLLCPPVPEDAVEFDPTLSRQLAPWLEGRAPLYRADLSDADGVVRRYAIYALEAGAEVVAAHREAVSR